MKIPAKLEAILGRFKNFLKALGSKKKIILSFLGALALILSLGVGVYLVRSRKTVGIKAEGPSISLVSATATTTYTKGEEVVADVYIDTKGLKVTGADLRVRYDPTYLQAKSIESGGFLPVVLFPGNISYAQAVRIVLGSDPMTPKDGSGILARVKFNVIAESGSTSITFGPSTAISAIGSQVNVVGQATPLAITISLPLGTPVSAPTVPPATGATAPLPQ